MNYEEIIESFEKKIDKCQGKHNTFHYCSVDFPCIECIHDIGFLEGYEKAISLSREQKDSELKIEIAELKQQRDYCLTNFIKIKEQKDVDFKSKQIENLNIQIHDLLVDKEQNTAEILELIKKHKKYFYDGIRDMPTDIGTKEMKNQSVNIFVNSILDLDEKIMAMQEKK